MSPSQAISDHIAPLLLAHGFAVVEGANNHYWMFRRGDLAIAFALDPRNSELSISLRDRRHQQPIEFWLFGKFVGDPEAEKLGAVMLSREDAEGGVKQIASAIERNIEVLLRWSPELADDLYARQSALSETGLRQQRLADALRRSDVCWRSKDYPRFVDAILQFKADLSPAMIKRLRYAQAHTEQRGTVP
jgi:hypothetical protein